MPGNPWSSDRYQNGASPERGAREPAANEGSNSGMSNSPARRGEGPSYEERFRGREQAEPVRRTSTGESGPGAPLSPEQPEVPELLEKLEEKRESMRKSELPVLAQRAEDELQAYYRELCLVEGNLAEISREFRVVYYTSSFPQEGKTTAAVNAAYGIAVCSRKEVLLTDSNHDSPDIHRLFGVPGEPGFQDVVMGDVLEEEAIWPTQYNHLYLLPAGSAGRMGLGEKPCIELLERLRANFDYVLVDGRSLLSSSEVVNAVPAVDGFLIVVECGKTKWEVVQRAEEKLVKAGAGNMGVVLNRRKYHVPEALYSLISRR